MKKFYFLMMALLVSLSSMAWTVKFTNPDNWAEVAVWAWDDNANYTGGTWPGALMTQEGDVWTYTGEGTPAKLIFNNNNKGSQTGNLDFVDGATYDMKGVVGAVATTYTCYFDNSKSNWSSVYAYSYNGYSTAGWPGVELSKNGDGLYVFSFESTNSPVGTVVIFNDGVGGTPGNGQTANLDWEDGATYDADGKVGDEPGPGPQPQPQPGAFYLIGQPAGGWSANVGTALEEENGVYVWNANLTEDKTFFGFASKLGATAADWTTLNSNRYGSNQTVGTEDSFAITEAGEYTMEFPNGNSWNLPAGKWIVTVNPSALTLNVQKDTTGIEAIEAEEGVEAVYYNLQGVRVANPENGMYIRVAGKTASKVYIR